MRALTLVALMITLPLFATAPAQAANPAVRPGEIALPAGTLTANQVKSLFVDKTVTSLTVAKQRKSVSYYSPDGVVRQLSDGTKRLGHWRITDNGRMCLQMEALPEKCRIVVNDNGVYKKYIVKKNGDHEHSITYEDFKAGNPLGL